LPALVQAFGRLQQRCAAPGKPQLRLALVGAGPQASSFQGMQVPGLVLPGEQHGLSLARWYSSADVFAFPSCSETFGNSVLEAQASGLPVVAYSCQVINERVSDGSDGFLAPLKGSLVEPLERLVVNPGLRASFAREARAKAERQSWQAVFDGLEQRYYDLVDGERQRQRALLEPKRVPDLTWPASVPSGISVLSR
jgi:glycosyltransferase involved in cell wall biosynthesis